MTVHAATVRTFDAPVVRRGRHGHPTRGACLLELAGTLPGGPWTDRPARVHPVLGVVCRTVNDLLSDSGRNAVLAAVPWLACSPTTARGLSVDNGLFALVCERAASPHAAAQRPSVRAMRRGIRRMATLPESDGALQALLFDAIDLVRAAAGLEPVAGGRLLRLPRVGRLPVRVETRCPDDSLSAYLYCRADLPHWPAELRTAWSAARDSSGLT